MKSERVVRPLGLTIAILGAIVFAAVIPLLEYYIARRLHAPDDAILLSGGIPFDNWTRITALAGILVIITGVVAWHGRLPYIRFIFQGAVILSVTLSFAKAVARSNPDTGLSNTFEEAVNTVVRCQTPLVGIILIYILWYLNRAPSRAFFAHRPLHGAPKNQNGYTTETEVIVNESRH